MAGAGKRSSRRVPPPNTKAVGSPSKPTPASCRNTACDFNRNRPLPILTVDEPIYRRLPAFLIATVDKFASLPWVAETGAFFGHVDRFEDGIGFYGPADPGHRGRPLVGGWPIDPT